MRAATTGLSMAVTGQWEGYQQTRFRDRPAARLVAQDTDLNFGTREKLMSEARRLCQVSPIPGAIANKYATYCIGNLRVQWRTGDRTIDALYESAWETAKKTFDVRGQHDLCELASLAVERMLIDGDIFFQKIALEYGSQIQVIEADRVTNCMGGQFSVDQPKVIGGIKTDSVGRPVSYLVAERSEFGTFKNPVPVEARDILHLWDTSRADAMRGVTAFHSVLDTLSDFHGVIGDETTSVTVNSRLALLVKNIMGSANASLDPFSNAAPVSATAGKVDVQEVGRGIMAYMFPNEDIKAHQSDRPSSAWLGLIELLISLSAIGLRLPKSVVWSMAGLSGPAARFENQTAGREFSKTLGKVERKFLVPLCGWWLSREIQAKRLPFTANWTSYRFQRPAGITIDLGRDTKSGIDEMNAGVSAPQDWTAEAGEDFYEVTEQRIEAAKYQIERCETEGVPLWMVRTPPQNMPAEQVAQDNGDAKEPNGQATSAR